MDITLKSDIAGFFSYKIYRENPDNVIYESPTQKNLIVNSGLKHLYSLSVPEVMKILDLGNSDIPAAPEDLGLRGPTFANSNIFNDLSALYLTGGFVSEDSTSKYTAFFRTKTTSSPTVLTEFVIKPGAKRDAFARQVFAPITLQAGDGIEFTYNVEVNHPCASYDTTLKLFYAKKVLGEAESFQDVQLPLVWTSVSSTIDDKFWTGIESNNTTVVAVASASNSPSSASSNIVYSTDSGQNWLSAAASEGATYSLNNSLNDVAFGTIIDGTGATVEKYVAVGLSAIYTSDTGSVWLAVNPPTPLAAEFIPGPLAGPQNWTGISFGRPTNTGKFVAVSNTGFPRIMVSSDATNWVAVNAPITNYVDWSAITYGGNYYVAVGAGVWSVYEGTDLDNRIAYSTDGVTWLSAGATARNEWSDIAYNSERDLFVAVSRNNATYSPIMYASGGDITKWYPARAPYTASWNSVTYGNGVFVAVGESETQQRAIFSSDGINWFPSTSIPSTNVWNAVTFSNNTFVAVASSLGTEEYPFARVDVLPRLGASLDVDAKISLLSVKDKIFNRNSFMYTLRDFDMPDTCAVSPATAEELLYSTTLPYNSYVKSTTSLISPNTAVSVYKFNGATGHGSIKNLLITDTVLLTGYKTPGLWAIELNADSQLTEPIVYTGELDNIVTLSPAAGAITRSISSTIGDIIESELQFNVYHTWGPAGAKAPPSDGEVILEIPNWTVIDTDDYSDGYYSDFVADSKMLLPNYILEGATGCKGQDVLAKNDITIEIKSYTLNVIVNNRPTDVIASVALNVPDTAGLISSGDAWLDRLFGILSIDYASEIIEDLRTTNDAISGLLVQELNRAPINAAYIKSSLGPVVRNVELLKRPGPDPSSAKIRIQLERSATLTPTHVIVYNNTIGLVDTECSRYGVDPGAPPAADGTLIPEEEAFLGPGEEQVATVFDITEIEVN